MSFSQKKKLKGLTKQKITNLKYIIMTAITTASPDVATRLNEIFTDAKISVDEKEKLTFARIHTKIPLHHDQLGKIMALGHIEDLRRSADGITLKLEISISE